MPELVVRVPNDVGMEFSNISEENWQLLFSRFIRTKLDELREIDSIVSKSKANEEQVKELSDKVRSAIAKRFLKK